MSYVGSQNINVFPSTKRGQYQRDARLMTESSLVGLINELIDFSFLKFFNPKYLYNLSSLIRLIPYSLL